MGTFKPSYLGSYWPDFDETWCNLFQIGSSCFWNGRGVCFHLARIRKKKSKVIGELCKRHDVVGLVELHGDTARIRRALTMACRTHNLYYTQCRKDNNKIDTKWILFHLIIYTCTFVMPPLHPCVKYYQAFYFEFQDEINFPKRYY